MAREKAPAFQFYPRDFLSDEKVRLMTYTERGVYITLLCLCWSEGSLPAKPEHLAGLLSWPVKRFEKLWAHGPLSQCFRDARDGRLSNKRLDEERQKQEEYRRRQTDNGRRGGRPTANPSLSETEPTANPSLSSPGFPNKSSASSSAFASALASASTTSTARTGRVVFCGQRLTIHEWMLDDCLKLLAPHAATFELDVWFDALDKRMVANNLVAPKRDGGAWVQAELMAEMQARGIPLRVAGVSEPGDDLAAIQAEIARQDRAVAQ